MAGEVVEIPPTGRSAWRVFKRASEDEQRFAGVVTISLWSSVTLTVCEEGTTTSATMRVLVYRECVVYCCEVSAADCQGW